MNERIAAIALGVALGIAIEAMPVRVTGGGVPNPPKCPSPEQP
jgi:hypothetical protein